MKVLFERIFPIITLMARITDNSGGYAHFLTVLGLFSRRAEELVYNGSV